MAHIKVPYQYVSYPFSSEATRLSQRLSKNKWNVHVVVSFVVYSLVIALISGLVRKMGVNTEGFNSLIFILLPLLPAIPCGRYAENLRTRLYHRAIRKALREDLIDTYPDQPQLVDSTLAQLTADFTDEKTGR